MTTLIHSFRSGKGLDSPISISIALVTLVVVSGLFFVYAMPAIGGGNSFGFNTAKSNADFNGEIDLDNKILVNETALRATAESWNH